MSLEPWIHFGHVLSAIVWVGGGLLLSIVGSRTRASNDPKAMAEFAQTLAYVGTRVMLPAVVGTLVFGVWMVLMSSDWNFAQFWVLFALGLFVLAFLIGAIYLGRIGIQLQRIAGESAANGAALLNRWIFGYRLVLALLLIALWDMIFKPGL